MSDPLPTSDAPTDPLDDLVRRDGEPTPHFPALGPPEWTNQPDVPEPFDPPACERYQAHSFHKLGGRGRVWRARDAELNRDVAFKEIRPKFANDPETLRRFIFEAEVTGRLDHPAVIPVYGFGHDAAGKPCYAMRFVEGKSLHEAIGDFYATSGPSGAERALVLRRLLAQFVTVCRAVDYAHSRGVIHRDLKPANILVGDFGETLVVDWGIAKRLQSAPDRAVIPAAPAPPYVPPSEPGHSRTGELIGTPAYWSPEQAAADPDRHDARTDVYGLGAVLFEVLTGEPPNVGGVPAPEPPSARARRPWSGIDAGIDAITRTALAFDPEDRYQTAAAVAEAVELWLADQPLVAQRDAVAALEQKVQERPDDPAWAEQFARQRSNLGLMLSGMGRDKEAVVELRAAAESFGRLAVLSREPRFLADQASALMSLSRSYKALDRTEMMRAMEQKAADLCKQLIVEQRYPDDLAAVLLSGSQIDINIESDLQQHADELAKAGVPPFADPDSDTDMSDFRPAAPADGWLDADLKLTGTDPDVVVPERPGGPPLTRTPSAVDLPPAPDAAPRAVPPAAVPEVPAEPLVFAASSAEFDLGPPGAGPDPIPMAAPVSSADFELPNFPSPVDSVADIATLGAPHGPGSSFDFILPDGLGSFADLPPVPAPPPDAKADDTAPGPRVKATDSVPDIDSLFPRAAGEPAPPAPPGSFLALASGYTRVRDLARGGMGRLYVARDENLNRIVVIKTLADDESAGSRAARRFRREVQITGSLEHPNLVRAYASGTGDDGRPYLVLEYLNGATLVRQLDVYGPGWGVGLLEPLAQACDGIHFAHARGIVHRDAKLSNIMVLPSGRTVLLDWGLGKVVGQQDSLDSAGGVPVDVAPSDDPMRSRAGAIVGTPAYMSPEQARGDAWAIGPRTDVFTFGANLFHLVSGKPPGHRDDLRALIARRRTGDIPRLRDARPDVPRRLDDICSRAMALRPEHRYPTAAAFATDLRTFLAGQK